MPSGIKYRYLYFFIGPPGVEGMGLGLCVGGVGWGGGEGVGGKFNETILMVKNSY